jgi:hypothetical protein
MIETSQIIGEIALERTRQIKAEGFNPSRDDGYTNGQLIDAAVNYAAASALCAKLDCQNYAPELGPPLDNLTAFYWPWAREWWKPGDRRRMLVKAAALLVAEIERIDRQTEAKEKGTSI